HPSGPQSDEMRTSNQARVEGDRRRNVLSQSRAAARLSREPAVEQIVRQRTVRPVALLARRAAAGDAQLPSAVGTLREHIPRIFHGPKRKFLCCSAITCRIAGTKNPIKSGFPRI